VKRQRRCFGAWTIFANWFEKRSSRLRLRLPPRGDIVTPFRRAVPTVQIGVFYDNDLVTVEHRILLPARCLSGRLLPDSMKARVASLSPLQARHRPPHQPG